MKIFFLLSLTLTVAFGVPVPEWVPMDLPEEAGPRLADILPVQGHVVQEDVKPDAGLEKVERPAELPPVVQEQAPAKQEVEEEPALLVPVVQDKPAEQESLVEQDKPAEQEPLVEQDKPAEQEPLVEQDKPAEQEPLVEQDKPAEQEPLVEQVQEEVQEEAQPEEDVLDENVSDLKENLLPEEEPAMEEVYIPSDEPEMRVELPEEEETVVHEVHPDPGRPRLVEEPTMELITEEEDGDGDMYGRLTEEEEEMAEVPVMVLEPLPEEEPVEDGAETETDFQDPRLRLVEEPTVELEPLFGEELTSNDEPGSEAVPGEEEELMEEEGPVMPGETVVEVEETPGQEPSMEMEPEEEPAPWARSGLAEGPLMDGMTVKQAMMEEEPDMWVGPDVVRERHIQDTEEDPKMWERTDDDAAAMVRGMDMDNEIWSSDGEQARPYAEDIIPMEGEFSDAVYTQRSSCSGAIIDGRCYQFYRGPKEAADAEFFCQNNFPNGHLASVTNPYIHQQMKNLMAQNGGYTRTWVGGLKYLKTGRFIWLDGAHWDYADWLVGEPNNTAGVEDCIELLSNGKFNDMPCWDLRAYICSYPL